MIVGYSMDIWGEVLISFLTTPREYSFGVVLSFF